MQIVALDPSFYKYYREDIVVLSSQARDRLRLVASFEQLRDKGISGEEAAQILGKSRATLYRWRKRLERGPRHLEPISSRPKRVRKADWSPELVQRVESLRRDFPAWGKETLAPLIQGEGFEVSEATVGRILRKLMDRGVIHRVRYRRQKYKNSRRMRRLHAQRLPKWCPRPTRPGERLQIDTLHLVPAPGKWLKHFSASCPVSRWTVVVNLWMNLRKPAEIEASPSMCCRQRVRSSTAPSNECRKPGEESFMKCMSYPILSRL